MTNPGFRILILALCLAGAAGCRSMGPSTVARDRHSYSDSISESWKRQTLMNIIKLRFHPPEQLHRELAGGVMLINHRPLLDPGAVPLERRGHPRHHHIRQAAFLQKIQKVPVKEPAVGPHRAQPRSFRQQREGLLQERDDPARRAGVAAA